MKKTGFLLLLAGMITISATAQIPVWQNEKITEINREPTRTAFISYDRGDDAVTYDRTKSPFFVSLNGQWDFYLAPGPDNLAYFQVPAYAGEQTKIDVPGYFASKSADDLSGLTPPALPARNQVGQYRTQIEIPVLWLDRDIFLHFDGVKGGMTLFVNGKEVGYTEEAGTPTEFNIAPYVTDGMNTIALNITQWSTADWLQNSTITGAGIEGDVYLYSQYKIHIHDFTADATLDSLYKNGILNLDVELVNNFNMADTVTLYYYILDDKANVIRRNSRDVIVPGQGRDTVRFEGKINNVNPWTPEKPGQYRLMMRLHYKGHIVEYIPYKIGFRTLETTENGYLLNGKPIEFRGYNYAFSGTQPNEQTMRADLAQLKKYGVNAIKCHYHPWKNRLYELCAELGLLVCDEVNLNSSLTGTGMAVGGSLANNPTWLNAHLTRMEHAWRMNRNHTSVVMWSMGTDAGIGYNLYESYLRLKSLEEIRPIVYGPSRDYWSTDIYFPADPNEQAVERWNGPRPAVASELGTDPALWQKIKSSPAWQGGFLTTPLGDAVGNLYK